MKSLSDYYLYKCATRDPRQMDVSEFQQYLRTSGVTVKGRDPDAIPISPIRFLDGNDRLSDVLPFGNYAVVD